MSDKKILAYPSYMRGDARPKSSTDPNSPHTVRNDMLTCVHFKFFERLSEEQTNDDSEIYLYMPSTLRNPGKVEWEQKGIGKIGNTMTTFAQEGFLDTLSSAYNEISFGDIMDIGKTMAQQSILGDAGAFNSGKAENPYLKMFFKGVGMRTFEYTFKFTPKSSDESRIIYQIIQEFRRASLPEKIPFNFYLNYPKEIEIKYLQSQGGGRFEELVWMNKFRRCVITSIDVDYASAGFYVPMRDGFPSETTLTLQFTETDIITRGDVDSDVTNGASF
jgi:hypothetical protein